MNMTSNMISNVLLMSVPKAYREEAKILYARDHRTNRIAVAFDYFIGAMGYRVGTAWTLLLSLPAILVALLRSSPQTKCAANPTQE